MERPPSQTANPEVNALHNEHLLAGMSPIIVCLYASENADQVIEKYDADETATDIDHYATSARVGSATLIENRSGWLGALSDLDSTNKFSAQFYNCLGLVIVGQELESKINISFLLHIDPQYFTGKTDSFTAIVGQMLLNVKERCVLGSVDSVVFAGRTNSISTFDDFATSKEYLAALTAIGGLVNDSLGFEPVVIKPKYKESSASTTVYFDTTARRLYLAQPQNQLTQYDREFLPSQAIDIVPIPPIAPKSFWDIPKDPRLPAGPWED